MVDPKPEFVIDAYHQLWHVEKSFRMSKHDLRARPIYHHKRDSIQAHLNAVFAALAVTRLIEDRTGWSTRSLCAPPAATAPSRSASATTPSPPRTPYRPTCATPWLRDCGSNGVSGPTRRLSRRGRCRDDYDTERHAFEEEARRLS